ncbi:MAG: radical SAM protein [Endomicrobium sp.]|jgi:radical SAM superfamily enzyme YgiQ (UPF0313 family)|nr:radical SAM protein [Endomicrobium sp.]
MNILLINPPIYDFAAYDLWSKPLGLLYLASILQKQGNKAVLLDYMDRNFFGIKNKSNIYGCGHYVKTKIVKPEALKHIPRNYSRYGLSKELAFNWLKAQSAPDLIIVTSVMTYWYPGVLEAIETAKSVFPCVPVILGGAYAALCYEHARLNSKADIVLKGSLFSLNTIFKDLHIPAEIPKDFRDFPTPYYFNGGNYLNSYAVLRVSQGCPFHCSYCAQDILSNGLFSYKPTETVFREIKDFADKGIKNIVFYDDALLYNCDAIIKPLLRKIIEAKLNINIHTPNGLHLRYLDLELAKLMKKANFICPRFSLETANAAIQKSTGAKITNEVFEEKAAILKQAGFKNGEFIIYLLMGIPEQTLKDVEESIKYVHSFGGKVSLSEYSYIPQTKDFENAPQIYKDEPLLHNKSAYPSYNIKDLPEIYRIKNLAITLNSLLACN